MGVSNHKEPSLRNETISIMSMDYDSSYCYPAVLYSRKGVGSDRVNKFRLPNMKDLYEYWPSTMIERFRLAILCGNSVEIHFDKNYLIYKLDHIQLVDHSSFLQEDTHLIQ